MKLKVNDLRNLINEEMRGVPEFVLRNVTNGYIDTIRKHVHKHITMTAKSPADARFKIEEANKVLKELEDEACQLLEDKLWQWLQRT